MYRWFLSLRYLRAHRTNWIGVAGLFVGITALITILSIMAGFLNESKKHLRGNLADVLVQPARYPGSLLKTDPRGMLDEVRQVDGVDGAAVQLQWHGILVVENAEHVLEDPLHGDISLVQLVGIDPADEFSASDLRDNLDSTPPAHTGIHMERVHDLDDPFALPPDLPERDGLPIPSAIVGAQLGTSLRLSIGDEFTIVTASKQALSAGLEQASNQSFVVSGFFHTGENEMDLQRIYFEREELSDFLDHPVSWTHATVRLEDYDSDKDAVVAGLRERLVSANYLVPDSRRQVQTWEGFRGNLLSAIQNEKVMMGVMLSLVLLVAGFTIFAIHSMLVAEKRRDIGILCALGATPRGILETFLLIGMWEVLLGATLGTGAGILLALNIDAIEYQLSQALGFQIFNRNIYLFDHIPSVIEVGGVAMIVAGAILITIAFTAIPAYRAARMDPIQALRSDS